MGDNNPNNQTKQTQIPYPTALQLEDGPRITSDQIVEIAPGEGQIPISYSTEPNWEPLAFVKHFSEGKFGYNYQREKYISPTKYIHSRLKSCDDRFASDPQYIFQCLDWSEK